MINAIIIDDEAKARRMMESLLKEYCPEVQVLATAEDVPSGVIAINKHKPHVLFLDVEMPGYTGFQLLDFFKEIDFEIIFTTAHSEYAIQAFRASAIDFLLKPIQISELIEAVEKIKNKTIGSQQRLNALQENFKENFLRKIALPVSEGLIFVNMEDIIYLEADGSYSHFITENETIMVSKRIKEYEESLVSTNNFFRVHRSYIVNLKKIKKILKADGGFLLLSNGKEIPIARERKQELLNLINHFED